MGSDDWLSNLIFRSIAAARSISNGLLMPLPGFKRKGENWDREKEVEVKKIRLSDFGLVKKSVFFSVSNLQTLQELDVQQTKEVTW